MQIRQEHEIYAFPFSKEIGIYISTPLSTRSVQIYIVTICELMKVQLPFLIILKIALEDNDVRLWQ